MKKRNTLGRTIPLIILSVILIAGCTNGGGTQITSSPAVETKAPETTAVETKAPETTAVETKAPETKPIETTQKEVITMTPSVQPIYLKVASYNIQHAAQGIDKIIDTLKQADADIVGMQEVDYLTSRVSGADQPKLIAEGAGYPYYKFVRAIDYKGGQYGTLILSKFPIESFEVVQLDAGTKEGRSYGHAVINVAGIRVDFFNTHLSYESLDLRTAQFKVLAGVCAECDRYILTGDFNTADYTEFKGFTGSEMINTTDRHYVTFPGNSSGIDNIVFRGGFVESCSGTIVNGSSDHYMLWAEMTLDPR